MTIMSTGGGNEDDDIPVMTQTRVNSSYDLNGKIMVAAIVLLSVVLVLITLLHVYARYLLRRQARHQAGIRELGLMHIRQWQASAEPPKTGLDPSVLAALPVYAYRQDGGECDRESTLMGECTVCLSLLEEGELMRILPNCKHIFHAECVDRWLGSQITCPVCRTEAEPRAQPAQAEAARDAESTAQSLEGTSEGGIHHSSKVGGSSLRLSSFRRVLSRERSSGRMPSCRRPDDEAEDLERS